MNFPLNEPCFLEKNFAVLSGVNCEQPRNRLVAGRISILLFKKTRTYRKMLLVVLSRHSWRPAASRRSWQLHQPSYAAQILV